MDDNKVASLTTEVSEHWLPACVPELQLRDHFTEECLASLKSFVFGLWVAGFKNDFAIGRALKALQFARSRQEGGVGTWMADLDELGIPYHKAYRLIKKYDRICAMIEVGIDVLPVRVLQSAKLKWPEIEEVAAVERLLEEEQADHKLREIQKAIEQAAKEVEQVRSGTMVDAEGEEAKANATLRVTLRLSADERLSFQTAAKKLGQIAVQQVILKAVCDEAAKD